MQKVLMTVVIAVLLTAASPFGQVQNPRAAAEAAMMKADRDFNQAAASRDMEKFLSLVSENAAFDSAEGRGREAIRKAWAPLFEKNAKTRLTWAPTKAESLVAGDVGYTIGTWERRGKDKDGNAVSAAGQYLTIWRKEKDGVWRATFDTGSTSPPAAPVSLPRSQL